MNEITDTSGLSTMASPTSAPLPVTRLTTPGGKPASAISSTTSVAQCGVSLDGLKTTVLPDHQGRHRLPARDGDREVPGGDDPGDAQRLADRHRPLVGQLGRDGVAEHPAAFARHQERDVDALLDVAARLGEDLAHLAGHRSRQALLVLRHQRAEPVQDLAALGGGRPAPHRPGGFGRLDRHGDIGGGALLEPPDDVSRVGGVAALEGRAARGRRPLPGDEVVEGGDGCGCFDRVSHGRASVLPTTATVPPCLEDSWTATGRRPAPRRSRPVGRRRPPRS